MRRKKKKRIWRKRRIALPLSIEQILAWADAHHDSTGSWPLCSTGRVHAARDVESWHAIDAALRRGNRTLPGGSSLARLLAEYRGVRNQKALPPFTHDLILAWADSHQSCTGTWPNLYSGPVADAPDETWCVVDSALRSGHRGLPCGSSLAQLLERARGVRNIAALPTLRLGDILAWADAYHQRTGEWPNDNSGLIPETSGDTWNTMDAALRSGVRGLPGASSLARLLAEHRQVRNIHNLPRLTAEQILAWADAHHNRTGVWPSKNSGEVIDSPGEMWGAIDANLLQGRRGLPGGSSIARLLAEHRGVRLKSALPELTPEQILSWADAHHSRTGVWPSRDSGPIVDAPEETWYAVHAALQRGCRGLPGGSSLAQVLAEHRGVRNVQALLPLTTENILTWADAHHSRTGDWPSRDAGPIVDAPGETWGRINTALLEGLRGMPGGSSLARLLQQARGVRNIGALPALLLGDILTWADAHHQREGTWPNEDSGPIADAPGETWGAVDMALRMGVRGLPGGSSLPRLLAEHRQVRNRAALPRLTVEDILTWADAHHSRTGTWPTSRGGPIPDTTGETWQNVDSALLRGWRGLPGGSSLARFLRAHGRGRTVGPKETQAPA